ncbi:transposase [Candidatus Williamhamiltonella defendens]|uniref:transposase n=1 Tax=Candidatus Williamhamiltonella defendens TaxID=138072 RepID=UPI00387E3EBA
MAPCQLPKWIRQYKAEMSEVTPSNPALTPEHREIQLLRARVKQLEIEKDILKQSAVLMSAMPVKSVRSSHG